MMMNQMVILSFLAGEKLRTERGAIGHCYLFTSLFEQTFDKPAPNPLMFGTPPPKQIELKECTHNLGISQAALKRAYGQFTLVDREDSQIPTSKTVDRIEFAVKILLVPFVLIAMFAYSAWEDFNIRRKAKKK